MTSKDQLNIRILHIRDAAVQVIAEQSLPMPQPGGSVVSELIDVSELNIGRGDALEVIVIGAGAGKFMDIEPVRPLSIEVHQPFTNDAEDVDDRPNHKRPYNKGRGTAAIKRAAKKNRRKK